jgi:hypothetical protein
MIYFLEISKIMKKISFLIFLVRKRKINIYIKKKFNKIKNITINFYYLY